MRPCLFDLSCMMMHNAGRHSHKSVNDMCPMPRSSQHDEMSASSVLVGLSAPAMDATLLHRICCSWFEGRPAQASEMTTRSLTPLALALGITAQHSVLAACHANVLHMSSQFHLQAVADGWVGTQVFGRGCRVCGPTGCTGQGA